MFLFTAVRKTNPLGANLTEQNIKRIPAEGGNPRRITRDLIRGVHPR
jgi:hypothetical protein